MTVQHIDRGNKSLRLAQPLARRHKLNRATLHFWFDMMLFGLLVGTAVSAFLNVQLHTYLGGALTLALLGHLVLHWSWISALAGRFLKTPRPVRLKALVDASLLLVLIPLLLSGGIVALIYAPAVTRFHSYACYLFSGLIVLHLSLNARWIMGKLKRRSR